MMERKQQAATHTLSNFGQILPIIDALVVPAPRLAPRSRAARQLPIV